MKMAHVSVTITKTPERVTRAILAREFEPFFPKSGVVLDPAPARWIQWSPGDEASLVGKVPYLRGKHESAVRFRIRLVPSQTGGTQAWIGVEHTTYSSVMIPVMHFLGLCMCCVGVVFTILGVRTLEKRFTRRVENMRDVLVAWDRATPM